MNSKVITICTPCRNDADQYWAMNFQQLVLPANYASVRLWEIGKPVAEARNALVQKSFDFVRNQPGKAKLEAIFWLDDDVLPDQYALVNLLKRKKDIVSGVYFTKDPWSVPLWYEGPGAGTREFIPDKFEKAGAHGMGLTLIRGGVYDRLRKELKLPKDSEGNTEWYKSFEKDLIFSAGKLGVLSMTEDFFFLGHCRTLGIESWIDSTRHGFGWHVQRDTKKTYPIRQWDEYFKGGTVTWETPDGPVVWGTPRSNGTKSEGDERCQSEIATYSI